MASDLQIVVVADPRTSRHALDESIVLLERLEQRWSRFLPNSDITALNNASGGGVEVDPVTVRLVQSMIAGWRATGGAFDPSILPTLCAAGYAASIENERLVTLLPDGSVHVGGHDLAATMDAIEIEGTTVRLPPGLTLDAGGVGKGFAADLGVEHLLSTGVSGALVCIGGDVVVAGTAPHDANGWVIEIEHPDTSRAPIGTIAVDAGGVATSSTRSRRWIHDGVQRHHLIDPVAGGQSSTDLATVTVVARTGWLAEVHATAALLAGAAGATDHLDAHELTGVAVALDGRVLATHDLQQLETPHPHTQAS